MIASYMGKITPTHRRNRPVTEFVDNNFALDRKIKEALTGVKPHVQWALAELSRDEDKELIADFILTWSNCSADGMPMTPNTKKGYIDALVYLARFHGHKKSFRQMTREDIVDGYLKSLKREFDEQNPEQKWVSTHNTRGAKYLSFWRWLTQPDLKREERQTPPQLKGFRSINRKRKTNTRREDFWTAEEHKVFLDYCEDLRLACYHAIARDTGGRPGELLQLKISDIKIKVSSSTGKKYAEFTIGDKVGGKMKKPRPVTISDAIPYFNIWKSVHPRRDSPQGAYLFPSKENKSMYHNVPLKPDSLRLAYVRTIEEHFPKLLLARQEEIPVEDKATLRSLIYDKPHYPYLRRHEFATEIAPKVPQYVFNQLMGHSRTSRMYDIYIQDLGNEGNRELQIARGIINKDETISQAQLQLQPVYCPICREANKSGADFCFSCNWVLSKKGMQEVRAADEKAQKDSENIKKKLSELETRLSGFDSMFERITEGKKQIEENFKRMAELKEEEQQQPQRQQRQQTKIR